MATTQKTKEKLEKHSQSSVHECCMSCCLPFKATEAHGSVANQLSKEHACVIQENKILLKSIFSVTILCTWQTIALWGHDETSSSENKGSFLICGDQRTRPRPQLRENCPHNNDLLKTASDVVVDQITKDIREAEAFSIIADETSDISRVEQVSICFCYVDHDNFFDIHDLDVKSLTERLVGEVQNLGTYLDLTVL